MNRLRVGIRYTATAALLISAGLASAQIASAQQKSSNPDMAGVQRLAKQFVDAINHRSLAERKAGLHPKSAACINAETQPYFDWIFKRQEKYVIPSTYTVKSEPLGAEGIAIPEAKADYPIRPTYSLQIDYTKGPYSIMSISLAVVKEGTNWYEVLPCPQPEAVKMVLARNAADRLRDEKVKQLIAALAEPVRSDIESMAKKGQRMDAIKKYQEVSGEDLTIAVSVIDTLVP